MKNPFTLLTPPRHVTATLRALTLALGLVALSACSPKNEATTAQPPAPAAASLDAYDQVARQAKGFTAGALMSANTVYVLFDPQCPHCGHLWKSAQPLLKKVKFVWVPVSIINAKSLPQGAALLSAANPVELMNTHEVSILAGTGGISASSSVADDIEKAIKTNTEVFNALRAESVPMLVAKHAKTGALIKRMGSLETPALAEFLGVEQP